MSRKQIGYLLRNGFIPFVDVDGEVTHDLSSTPSTNILKRRGDVVLFDFNATVDFVAAGTVNVVTLTIPEGFRPKKETAIYCLGQITDLGLQACGGGVLGTDGTLELMISAGIPVQSKITSLVINTGWEIEEEREVIQ